MQRSVHQSTMFALIEEQLHSGLSKKDFCEQKGLKPSTFHYWKNKYTQKQEGPVGQEGFIPLGPVGPASVHRCTVRTEGGRPLHLESDSLEGLARLLHEMARLSHA